MEITKHVNDVIQKYTCALLRDIMPEFYGFKTGKVKELINPELPEIKVKGGGTDVVFLMEDESYLHIGFESGKDGDDIIRHLDYDVRLIQRDGRTVNTIIVYTADVKTAPEVIQSDTLEYKPHIILMHDYDGNDIFTKLEAKLKAGQELTDADILNLIFLPLMRHTIPRQELVEKSIALAKTISDVGKRNACTAAAFAFASKYLDEAETAKILEVLKVTDLGTMLVMDKLTEVARRLLQRGMSIGAIVEDTGLEESTVKRLLQEELINE